MNEKFFNLPIEKQERIINAGYRVFSQNSYKKSPMSEIADAAGISKSLLFHYFLNKKELYMFLWDNCAKTTVQYLTEYKCYEQKDLFEMMYRGMQAKMEIIRKYPDMARFVIKAYYEKDPAVCDDIRQSYQKLLNMKSKATLMKLEPEKFMPGLNLQMMYREMFWAAEGYLWEKVQQGSLNMEKMEDDFGKLIEFWKSVYLRNG
ncbi:MAG: TetR/AcrR family transcriptional regulator [Eubacterium sp.]|nr:TetR/AcrR family transcriptional regulator [Eubacterium sp.]